MFLRHSSVTILLPLLLGAVVPVRAGPHRANNSPDAHMLISAPPDRYFATLYTHLSSSLALPHFISAVNPFNRAVSISRSNTTQFSLRDQLRVVISEPRLSNVKRIRVRAVLSSNAYLNVYVDQVDSADIPIQFSRQVRLEQPVDSASPVKIRILYDSSVAVAVQLLLQKQTAVLRRVVAVCDAFTWPARLDCLFASAAERCSAGRLQQAQSKLLDKSCRRMCAQRVLTDCSRNGIDFMNRALHTLSRSFYASITSAILFMFIGGAILTISTFAEDFHGTALYMIHSSTNRMKHVIKVLCGNQRGDEVSHA